MPKTFSFITVETITGSHLINVSGLRTLPLDMALVSLLNGSGQTVPPFETSCVLSLPKHALNLCQSYALTTHYISRAA